MTALQYKEIRLQLSIVEQRNQVIGCLELSNNLTSTKRTREKLIAAKAEARNSATVLMNLVRSYSN